MVPPGDKNHPAEVALGRWEQDGRQLGHISTEASPHRRKEHQSMEPKGDRTWATERSVLSILLYINKSAECT